MKTSTILLVLGVGAGGYLVYKASQPPATGPNTGSQFATAVNAGTGFVNAVGGLLGHITGSSPKPTPTENPAPGAAAGSSSMPINTDAIATNWSPFVLAPKRPTATRLARVAGARALPLSA